MKIEWLNPKKPVRRLNPYPIFKIENFQSIYEIFKKIFLQFDFFTTFEKMVKKKFKF